MLFKSLQRKIVFVTYFKLLSKLISHISPGFLHSQLRFILVKRFLFANGILLRDVSARYISLEHWQFNPFWASSGNSDIYSQPHFISFHISLGH